VKLAEWGPKETGGVADDDGTERNHKSEEEDLMPDKKGASEEGESKISTELEVKTARPLGRGRGEIPTRE
jgi:hypothetical protein